MFELKENIEPSKQYIQEPEIIISGNSISGTRSMVINIPVVDETGRRLNVLSREYIGGKFNEVYSIYISDKALITKVLNDLNIEADISGLSDDLTN